MDVSTAEKALKVGVVATYLIKPVSPQTLKETIEEYTKGSLTPDAVSPKKRQSIDPPIPS
jgi:response regulator of citrate/malate metabolism